MNLTKSCTCELPLLIFLLSVFSFNVSHCCHGVFYRSLFSLSSPYTMGSHPALSFTLLNCHGSNTHQSFACKNQSACRRVCDLLYSPCSDSWKNSLLCGFDISVPDKLSCHPCLFHYGPLQVQVCHCNLVRPRLCAPSTEPPC